MHGLHASLRRIVSPSVVTIAALGAACQAQAESLSFSSIQATVVIRDVFDGSGSVIPKPDDLIFSGEVTEFPDYSVHGKVRAMTSSLAAVLAEDPDDIPVGGGAIHEAFAESSAISNGFASLYLLVSSVTQFRNRSVTETYSVAIAIDYSFRVEASVDSAVAEDSFSYVVMDAWDFNTGSSIASSMPRFELADGRIGPSHIMGGESLLVTYTLPPGATEALVVTTISASSVVAAIPEPPSLAMAGVGFLTLASGLAGWRWVRRRAFD